MQFKAVTNSTKSLLMLTRAVIELTLAASALDPGQLREQEMSLLTYHRIKQTDLINQLYEVLLVRLNSATAREQFPHSTIGMEESEETALMEAFVRELLAETLKLVESGTLPKEDHIVSVERLHQTLLVHFLPEETELFSLDPANVNKEETKKAAVNLVNPTLFTAKSEPRSNQTKEKKDNSSFQIRIGTNVYRGTF